MSHFTNAQTNLSCELIFDSDTINVGTVPEFDVVITNNSLDTIYLVGSLDGSEYKSRYTHVFFDIVKP